MVIIQYWVRKETQRGAPAILFQENLFGHKRTNKNGSERWVCTVNDCSCSIVLKNDKIMCLKGIHAHKNTQFSAHVDRVISDVKPKAVEDPKIPIQQICDDEVIKFICEHLLSPGSCEHWSADRTFRTAPKMFGQSYSIHAWNDLSMKPLAFAAMPNKFVPRSVLIDFEQDELDAFEAVFPGIDVKLYHFHFGQNIWKRIQKYGLVNVYKVKQIRQQLANILSLPLMPPDDVIGLFVDIIEELSNLDNKF
ncbi:unnamed protein product [Didymodactylos carnosus]|uniref:FLYWCH-type domain-containing protein n=1 Tax=Didymodactylos carnosus TaxID=1234261 RepID=A0A814VB36_9BILA|nr:unnamed protein product [Didymodactylos carnosus]CAF3949936.1 unnamed protein product [Didymodactylos carnosus]